jgi:hypothetical protein
MEHPQFKPLLTSEVSRPLIELVMISIKLTISNFHFGKSWLEPALR